MYVQVKETCFSVFSLPEPLPLKSNNTDAWHADLRLGNEKVSLECTGVLYGQTGQLCCAWL
jgi:hypothetical protein